MQRNDLPAMMPCIGPLWPAERRGRGRAAGWL